VRNIQDDTTSKSINTLETKSSLNQLCLVNNSNTLAAATDKGIELYDMNRVFSTSGDADMRYLDFGEVLKVQSM
jgi:hypothetical protein